MADLTTERPATERALANISELDAFVERTADDRLAEFLELLRLPSIGTLSAHDGDVRATAELIAARLDEMGFENVEVSPTGGHPIVYADWLHAEGAPTVLVYAHYDVQPVDPLDLWHRAPFDPVVENGRVYARGAADDKSHVIVHMWAARAWLETHGRLPVNLKFIFEGEEESGSDNFDPWIVANQERLRADLAVISDSGFYEGNRPAITIGLRGLIYAQIDVTGSQLDLHSGTFGGNVQNPANALASIVARLKNDDGSVAVPGFYDEVRVLTPREREEFERMPFSDEQFVADYGLHSVFGDPNFMPLERRGARPTLDVNGIWGGYQGEGSKTVIAAKAGAKISMRLVPGQDPERITRLAQEFIPKLAPEGVTVEVRALHGGQPVKINLDNPYVRAAGKALERVYGKAPAFTRGGGSIPIVAAFRDVLKAPVVLVDFGLNADAPHSPNESFALEDYHNGILTSAYLLQELSQAE